VIPVDIRHRWIGHAVLKRQSGSHTALSSENTEAVATLSIVIARLLATKRQPELHATYELGERMKKIRVPLAFTVLRNHQNSRRPLQGAGGFVCPRFE
jgi:hypothetical protein